MTLGMFGVALLLAAFVAPFASALPDGLETTAKALGFAAAARPAWPAPMPDYGLPWPRLAIAAPAVAGIVGTVAVGLLAWAISRTLAVRDDAAHR